MTAVAFIAVWAGLPLRRRREVAAAPARPDAGDG